MVNQMSYVSSVLDVLPAWSVFILAELPLLVLVNSNEVTAVTAVVTDVPVKVPAHNVAKKTSPWTTSREPATVWKPVIDGKSVSSLLPENSVVERCMCYYNNLQLYSIS